MLAQNKSEVYFQVIEHIGVLNKNSKGWSKEINLISWNGGTPKFDIRDWDEEHEHMSKGITLKSDECKRLLESLLRYNNKNIFQEVKLKEEEKRKKWKENHPNQWKKNETLATNAPLTEDKQATTSEPIEEPVRKPIVEPVQEEIQETVHETGLGLVQEHIEESIDEVAQESTQEPIIETEIVEDEEVLSYTELPHETEELEEKQSLEKSIEENF